MDKVTEAIFFIEGEKKRASMFSSTIYCVNNTTKESKVIYTPEQYLQQFDDVIKLLKKIK